MMVGTRTAVSASLIISPKEMLITWVCIMSVTSDHNLSLDFCHSAKRMEHLSTVPPSHTISYATWRITGSVLSNCIKLTNPSIIGRERLRLETVSREISGRNDLVSYID